MANRKGILIRRPEHLRVPSDYKCSRGILIRRPASTSTAQLHEESQIGGALTRAQAKRAKLEENLSQQKVNGEQDIQAGDDEHQAADDVRDQVTML